MNTVFYHRDMDGIASAHVWYVAHAEEKWDYKSIQYGEEIPFFEGKHVCFVDFTPTIEQVQALLNIGVEITCYDHHDTARKTHIRFEQEPKFQGVLDTTAKGCCGLMLQCISAGNRSVCEATATLIGNRDVWDFSVPGTKEFHEWCLAFGPDVRDYNAWFDVFSDEDIDAAIRVGAKLLKKQDEIVAAAVKGAKLIEIDKVTVTVDSLLSFKNTHHLGSILAVNSSNYPSEIGNALAQASDDGVGLVYSISEGKLRMSFRSIEGSVSSAQEWAKLLGGGGHVMAAGASSETFEITEKRIRV